MKGGTKGGFAGSAAKMVTGLEDLQPKHKQKMGIFSFRSDFQRSVSQVIEKMERLQIPCHSQSIYNPDGAKVVGLPVEQQDWFKHWKAKLDVSSYAFIYKSDMYSESENTMTEYRMIKQRARVTRRIFADAGGFKREETLPAHGKGGNLLVMEIDASALSFAQNSDLKDEGGVNIPLPKLVETLVTNAQIEVADYY